MQTTGSWHREADDAQEYMSNGLTEDVELGLNGESAEEEGGGQAGTEDVPTSGMKAQGAEFAFESICAFVDIKHSGGSTKTQRRQILEDINGKVKPGQLLAIMGPSGSGKTSLLEILAGRVSLETTGQVTLNGRPVTKQDSANFGFVRQDDYHFGFLTVREVMYISAWLRMPKRFTSQERYQRIDTLLHDLGLWKCRDTRVGGGMVKGISGGERKRLSVGVELITDPGALFLDEPTSGLDSTMALTLFRKLDRIKHQLNRPIICTIHQPSAKLFSSFDLLLLLSEGAVVYFGQSGGALDYFTSLGLRPPPVFNPCDFFLDVCSIGQSASSQVVKEGVLCDNEVDATHEYLVAKWKEQADAAPRSFADGLPKLEKGGPQGQYASSFWTQLRVLTWRAWIGFYRSKEMMLGIAMKFLLMSLLVGMVFVQVGDDQSGVRNREAAIFFMVVQMTTGPLMAYLSTFGLERTVVGHERDGKWYMVLPYFMGKTAAELVMDTLLPMGYLLVSYWMVGLHASATNFFSFWGVLIVLFLCASSLAMTISALTPNFQVAGMVSGLCISVSGFLLIACQVDFLYPSRRKYVRNSVVVLTL